MAELYLKRKSGTSEVISRDGSSHPNAVIVLDSNLTNLILKSSLVITANYYRSIEDFGNGKSPIDYLSPITFIYNEHTDTTYEDIITDYLDINLLTGEITPKNADVKTAILTKLDSEGVALSTNWEFPT